MNIETIREYFCVIYGYLCKCMGIDPNNFVWVTFTDRVPAGAIAKVWLNGLYPRVGLREGAVFEMDEYDLCQLLAHEAVHICLWQKGGDYKDNSKIFENTCEKFNISTNKCGYITHEGDFTTLLNERIDR